jgi:hypothetical protein
MTQKDPPNEIVIHKFRDPTYYNYVFADRNKCFFGDINGNPDKYRIYRFPDNTYYYSWGLSVDICELTTSTKYIKLHQDYFFCYPYKIDRCECFTLWNLPWTDLCDSVKWSAATVKDSCPVVESWYISKIKIKGFPNNVSSSQIEDYVNGIIDKGELDKYGAQFAHF